MGKTQPQAPPPPANNPYQHGFGGIFRALQAVESSLEALGVKGAAGRAVAAASPLLGAE